MPFFHPPTSLNVLSTLSLRSNVSILPSSCHLTQPSISTSPQLHCLSLHQSLSFIPSNALSPSISSHPSINQSANIKLSTLSLLHSSLVFQPPSLFLKSNETFNPASALHFPWKPSNINRPRIWGRRRNKKVQYELNEIPQRRPHKSNLTHSHFLNAWVDSNAPIFRLEAHINGWWFWAGKSEDWVNVHTSRMSSEVRDLFTASKLQHDI